MTYYTLTAEYQVRPVQRDTPEKELAFFAGWLKGAKNFTVVGDTTVRNLRVVTRFTGIPSGGTPKMSPDPLVFATRVHDLSSGEAFEASDVPGYHKEYSSWKDAVEGHKATVAKVKRLLGEKDE